MEVLLVILVGISLIVALQLRRIASLQKQNLELLRAVVLSNEDSQRSVESHTEATRESLYSIQASMDGLDDKINNINYIMDVIYKYKLPNKEQRALHDQIEIDNEVFDGITKARG